MDVRLLHEAHVALLLIAETGDDEEDDVAVLSGPCTWDGSRLWIDYGDPDHQFPVPEECWDRFEETPEDVRDIFNGARFYASIGVGNLAEDADYSRLSLTGLQWPKEEPESESGNGSGEDGDELPPRSGPPPAEP